MNTEIIKREENNIDRPLTSADIRAQVNLIQAVLKDVMQENQHYGILPGTKKPSLWKPGAEKIMATFGLSADPIVEDLFAGDIIRIRVKCRLTTQSGIFKGAGVGECSSEEEKYKWRAAVCDEEYAETPENKRREKFSKTWNDRERKFGFVKIKQVRMNPFDLSNTILKMAKKRSMIDGVLSCTGASDMFTQDIEDLPEEYVNQKTQKQEAQTKPVDSKPQPEKQSKPQPNLGIIKERISKKADEMGIDNAELKKLCKELMGKTSSQLTEIELLDFEKKLEARRMENDDIPDYVETPEIQIQTDSKPAVEYFPDVKINSEKRLQLIELFRSAGCTIEKEMVERVNLLGTKITDLTDLTFAQADKIIVMLNGYLKK